MIDKKRPHPVPGYQMEVLDGEILLFHPASTKMMYSNRSGALIWQLCDTKRTTADICHLLETAYPESAEQITNQVHHTLQTFAKHGAITWV